MKIEPAFILFLDCPQEEMERRVLNRNQVSFLSLYFFQACFIITLWNFDVSTIWLFCRDETMIILKQLGSVSKFLRSPLYLLLNTMTERERFER